MKSLLSIQTHSTALAASCAYMRRCVKNSLRAGVIAEVEPRDSSERGGCFVNPREEHGCDIPIHRDCDSLFAKVVSGFSRRDVASTSSVAVHERRLSAERASYLRTAVCRLKPLTTLRELPDIAVGRLDNIGERADNAGNFPNTPSADSDNGCEFSNIGREFPNNAENLANNARELSDNARSCPNNVGGVANNAFSRANTARKFANIASKLANTSRKLANNGLIFSNTDLIFPVTV